MKQRNSIIKLKVFTVFLVVISIFFQLDAQDQLTEKDQKIIDVLMLKSSFKGDWRFSAVARKFVEEHNNLKKWGERKYMDTHKQKVILPDGRGKFLLKPDRRAYQNRLTKASEIMQHKNDLLKTWIDRVDGNFMFLPSALYQKWKEADKLANHEKKIAKEAIWALSAKQNFTELLLKMKGDSKLKAAFKTLVKKTYGFNPFNNALLQANHPLSRINDEQKKELQELKKRLDKQDISIKEYEETLKQLNDKIIDGIKSKTVNKEKALEPDGEKIKASEEYKKYVEENQEFNRRLINYKAGVSLLSNALNVTGNHELAYKFSVAGNTLANFAHTMHKWKDPLDDSVTNLSMLASSTNLALTLISLTQDKGPGFEEIAFDMLKNIAASIKDLRENMNRRFDQMNDKMDKIYEGLTSQLQLIRGDIIEINQKINHIRTGLIDIKRKIDNLEKTVVDLYESLVENRESNDFNKCITGSIDINKKLECLTMAEGFANISSRSNGVVYNPGNCFGENMTEEIFNNQFNRNTNFKQYSRLINLFASINNYILFKNDGTRYIQIPKAMHQSFPQNGFPNPEHWKRFTQEVLRIVMEEPDLLKHKETKFRLRQLHKTAQNLKGFYEAINSGVIFKAIEVYNEKVEKFLKAIKEVKLQTEIRQRLPFEQERLREFFGKFIDRELLPREITSLREEKFYQIPYAPFPRLNLVVEGDTTRFYGLVPFHILQYLDLRKHEKATRDYGEIKVYYSSVKWYDYPGTPWGHEHVTRVSDDSFEGSLPFRKYRYGYDHLEMHLLFYLGDQKINRYKATTERDYPKFGWVVKRNPNQTGGPFRVTWELHFSPTGDLKKVWQEEFIHLFTETKTLIEKNNSLYTRMVGHIESETRRLKGIFNQRVIDACTDRVAGDDFIQIDNVRKLKNHFDEMSKYYDILKGFVVYGLGQRVYDCPGLYKYLEEMDPSNISHKWEMTRDTMAAKLEAVKKVLTSDTYKFQKGFVPMEIMNINEMISSILKERTN